MAIQTANATTPAPSTPSIFATITPLTKPASKVAAPARADLVNFGSISLDILIEPWCNIMVPQFYAFYHPYFSRYFVGRRVAFYASVR
ncbi:hypothetical protein [Fulvimarina sp. MAC3]|uniref:hypothetical protein n=1 Tax=Fulvimarina sp. MAC3 TaxID=3148887 RepID=UPI0031FE1CDC